MTIEIEAPQHVALASDASDAELVRAVRAGNIASYEVLIRRHNQRLFRVARAVTAHDAAALDALQEGYLRAFRKLDQLDDTQNVVAWMGRIVRNEALMALRKNWRELPLNDVMVDRELDEAQMHRRVITPEELATQSELRGLLEPLIEALAVEYREVFVLRAVEGLSVKEVGEMLQLPQGTVKSRFFRARALLQADIEARLKMPLSEVYSFDGKACDRVTEAVMQRIVSSGHR